MCLCGRDPKEEEEGKVKREEGTEVHLGNLLQSEGGVAVAGPVQIVPVRRGAVRSPGPSAPPAAGLPAQGPGGVTSRGHVAAAAAGSGRAWALGSRGRCWRPGTPAPGDRPAAAAHTAGAAGAAAVAAAGDSDPEPSIATLRVSPEVFAAAAAHIQLAGRREPALPGRASRSPSPPQTSPPRAATPSRQKARADPRRLRRLPRRPLRATRRCPAGLSDAGPGLPLLLLLLVRLPLELAVAASEAAARSRAAGFAVAARSRTLLSCSPHRPAGPFCPRAARLSRYRDLRTPLCVCAAGSGRSSSLTQ